MDIKKEFERWLANATTDADVVAELKTMDVHKMEDAFYRDLAFGTGGLRGVIGAGTNRMNIYTVAKASQGLSSYLKRNTAEPSVVIGYDSRIKSDVFAKIAAGVFVANGIKVNIWPVLMPVPTVAKWYGTPIKEKISGSDLFPLLCKMAAEKKYTMYFLGAAEGVAAKAADNLMKRYKGLQVVGTYSPPYGFENDQIEMNKIKTMIRNANPHILIVGLGCPKQEKFIYYNRKELGVPISLGLGASFDFEAGNIKRAPKWMADHGLEWLFRIMQDPKRMAKRYLFDDRKIFKLAFKYKLKF